VTNQIGHETGYVGGASGMRGRAWYQAQDGLSQNATRCRNTASHPTNGSDSWTQVLTKEPGTPYWCVRLHCEHNSNNNNNNSNNNNDKIPTTTTTAAHTYIYIYAPVCYILSICICTYLALGNHFEACLLFTVTTSRAAGIISTDVQTSAKVFNNLNQNQHHTQVSLSLYIYMS
jgi:hypothetical protein